MMAQLQRKGIYFGMVMLASSAMNNLFVTYYLDYFINVVQMDASSFFLGQTIFMIWNAFNDPVFGYLSDQFSNESNEVIRRSAIIKYGGVFWSLAFVVVFLPVSSSNYLFQFTLALCFYDGMLTLVEVNHSALLADISVNPGERATLNAYAAVGAGVGSLSSIAGHVFWNKEDLFMFRYLVFIVASLCGICFYVAAEGLRSYSYCRSNTSDCDKEQKVVPISTFWRQLLKHRNLWLFQLLYFFQVFDCSFGKNHFGIFLDRFAGSYFSPSFLGIVISTSFLLPWIVTILMTPSIRKQGLYSVVNIVLLVRVGLCVSFMPVTHPAIVTLFILANRVVSESICRVCPLIISDLVDEDKYLNKRSGSVSASLVGFSTLLGKMSQSLAPMLGFTMLQKNNELISYVMIFSPLTCVVIQLFIWSLFTLKGPYLKLVKQIRPKSLV